MLVNLTQWILVGRNHPTTTMISGRKTKQKQYRFNTPNNTGGSIREKCLVLLLLLVTFIRKKRRLRWVHRNTFVSRGWLKACIFLIIIPILNSTMFDEETQTTLCEKLCTMRPGIDLLHSYFWKWATELTLRRLACWTLNNRIATFHVWKQFLTNFKVW